MHSARLVQIARWEPRIHAGELDFQAERLAWDYSPPALAAGVLKPGLNRLGKTYWTKGTASTARRDRSAVP
jgi:hypothetical protein